jgi:hypothetical protein
MRSVLVLSAWALALGLAAAPCGSEALAQAAPAPAANRLLPPDKAAALLRALRLLLNEAAAPPAGENAPAVVLRIATVLEEHRDQPSESLSQIRALLQVPAPEGAAAAPQSEAQLVGVIGGMVKKAFSPQAPDLAAARLLLERPNSHPDPNVLEHSHMYFATQGMLFEAQIAPHIFFFDNLKGLYDADVGKHRWGWALSFTPMIRLRNLDEESGPIKTLSWMPKLDLQVVRMRRDSASTATSLTLHGTVGHHSNGQDECTYEPGILGRDDLCPPPSRPEDVTINYPNGSFSTNYLRLGVVWKRYRLVRREDYSMATRALTFGLYGETHPPGLKIGGTLAPPLRPLYGSNRLRATAAFETRVGPSEPDSRSFWKGSVRLESWGEYIDKIAPGLPPTFTTIPDAPLNALYVPGEGSSRFRFLIEAAWTPDWLRGWGLEVRYHHGQDYYNLLFIRDIHWFQAGIVFDAAEFLPFKKGQ